MCGSAVNEGADCRAHHDSRFLVRVPPTVTRPCIPMCWLNWYQSYLGRVNHLLAHRSSSRRIRIASTVFGRGRMHGASYEGADKRRPLAFCSGAVRCSNRIFLLSSCPYALLPSSLLLWTNYCKKVCYSWRANVSCSLTTLSFAVMFNFWLFMAFVNAFLLYSRVDLMLHRREEDAR